MSHTTFKYEKPVNSDWLVYEDDSISRYSRDNVVIGANQTVVAGQPLEWGDVGKTFAIPMTDGTAGNGMAGIAISDVVTGAATQTIAAISRHARVIFTKLYFPTGTSQTIKDNTKAAMKTALPSIVFTEADI